ncbi:MAG: hypothetical protein HY088_03680, partial [Ignavibacteriales bacterium]|nr:hypothetical protein [Ignavibacteriales bacterium]
MKTRLKISVVCFAIVSSALAQVGGQDSLRHPDEKHLRNIRQLTFGGTNAEAYFSFDEKKLIFQSTRSSYRCDQIFTMNLDG